jgi:hypothetical protein
MLAPHVDPPADLVEHSRYNAPVDHTRVSLEMFGNRVFGSDFTGIGIEKTQL